MVDKVTAANKRIAAKSAKQVIKPPPVISTTGFEIPSARKGKSLYDTLNAFKFKTGMDASEYIMGKGLPPIGKTGGEQSLELINKIVDPKDKYIKIPAELRDLEKQRYGGDNKKFKLNKMNLSKNLFSIQKEADNLFGTETTKQKIKFIEKAANKMGIVLKDVAKMGFRNLMPALGPVGVVLSIGMSKEANAGEDEFFEQREADRIKQRLMEENNITQEQINKIANQPMDLLAPINKQGGGMMNMDEMIRPLGMRQGGDPVQERMLMLRDSMRDDENQRMREPDVTSVALTIAKQQGDTSEDNINMIIRQLMAMVPSVNKTAKDELTPTMNKGIQSLLNKISVMMGKKSDPQLNRNVGFERVE